MQCFLQGFHNIFFILFFSLASTSFVGIVLRIFPFVLVFFVGALEPNRNEDSHAESGELNWKGDRVFVIIIGADVLNVTKGNIEIDHIEWINEIEENEIWCGIWTKGEDENVEHWMEGGIEDTENRCKYWFGEGAKRVVESERDQMRQQWLQQQWH